jgi:hypothetical protein
VYKETLDQAQKTQTALIKKTVRTTSIKDRIC